MSKQKKKDQQRREYLQEIVHDHLLDTNQLGNVEGMAIDANVIKGRIKSWTWRVKLTDGNILRYDMTNTDSAPIFCNGEEVTFDE